METKNCKNCAKDFTLGPEDFAFYEKMHVPAPTWCVDCRLRRRLAWRNERNLSKRQCQVPGHTENIISMYSEDDPVTTYDVKTWATDEWDAMDYGKEFDPSRPFFEQFKELTEQVPFSALNVLNLVNSDYTNYGTDLKNCYLTFGGDFSENCLYSTFNFHSRDSAELYFSDKCEMCYECVDTNNCHRVRFSQRANNCSDSLFLLDCSGLTNCLGCVNLRNKSYCIFNEQYSKEEYEQRLKGYKLETREGLEAFKKEFQAFAEKMPRRFAHIFKSVDSSGDTLTNTKNCKNCFEVTGPAEDLKDVFLAGWGLRDAQGVSHAGHNSELVFDSWGIFSNASKVAYSMFISDSHDIMYSYVCKNSSNLFGCVGIRNKQYCILNKQYTKEGYEDLKNQIIEQMKSAPFVSKTGKTYPFGEFFPEELSPFPYNKSVAQEYFPLAKEIAGKEGLRWAEVEKKTHQGALEAQNLPATQDYAPGDFINKAVTCLHKATCNDSCTGAYILTAQEIDLYRSLALPLPQLCPNCRHYTRFRLRNFPKTYARSCECVGNNSENLAYTNTANHFHGTEKCSTAFQTTYSPERPETIYCEQCYQAETA